VIVVDDGSKDRTYELVNEWMSRWENGENNFKLLKNEKNMGKGAAVRRGMLKACGEIRLFMDADNSTRIKELEKALPLLAEGCELVVSSRKLKESLILKHQPLLRRMMSRAYNAIITSLLKIKFSDYNCGFKVFKDYVAEKIFRNQKINGWVFDAEILFLAQKCGYRVEEIPIIWEHKATSKVKPLRDTFLSLKGVWDIKRNALRREYED
jgi:glycosyltransferase involved in cell wall biosynthesis